MSAYNVFNSRTVGGKNVFRLTQDKLEAFSGVAASGVTSISQGAGIICTPNPITSTGTVSLSGTVGTINTASNVGAGAGVFKQVVGDDLEFRSITGTGAIVATENTDEVDLELTAVAAAAITYSGVNGTGLAPELTVVDGATTFDLSAGNLQFFDYTVPNAPVGTPIIYPGATGIPCTLLGNPSIRVVYISINQAGTVLQDDHPPTPVEALTQTLIGNLSLRDDVGTNDVIFISTGSPITAYGTVDALRQYVISKGGINLSGMEFIGRVGDFSFDNTSGIGLRFGAEYLIDKNNPDMPEAAAQTPVGFIRNVYTNAAGDLISISSTGIDVTQYNNNGVLAAVSPIARFQVFKLFYFYGSNATFAYSGNALYSTLQDAIDSVNTETWIEHPNTREAAPRGYFAIAGSAVDTSSGTYIPGPNERGGLSGGGAGGTTTLQEAYNNGSSIILNSTDGNVLIQDDATPLGTDLFAVNDNAAAASLAVTASQTSVKRLQVASPPSKQPGASRGSRLLRRGRTRSRLIPMGLPQGTLESSGCSS
jgi:hypothetical protein